MCLRTTAKFLTSLCFIALVAFNVQAKTDTSRVDKKIGKAENSTQKTAKQADTVAEFPENYVPRLHEDVIKDRLSCIKTTINLTYSKEIISWIKFYLIKNRMTTQQLLEKSSFYFPIFEEALKRHNIPTELKYLPIVESALRPRAVSWAAAAGLWQFIPSTGREYGLRQDWYIDERYDIYKATEAACRYLKFLYNYHGDWQLALAAYNCGPGRVDWAVKKAGGKNNFWKIYKYLPRETRGYVPAFIGVTYVMNYADKHNIYAKRPVPPIPSDTILVSRFVNLHQFARQIDVPFGVMQILNAHLKKNAIPNYKKNYPLRFPAHKRTLVDQYRGKIIASSRSASSRGLGYTAGYNQAYGKARKVHYVEPGESLALIALRYGTTVAYLRVWNRLRSNMVYPRQKLVIYSKPPRRNRSKLGQQFVAAVHEMNAKDKKVMKKATPMVRKNQVKSVPTKKSKAIAQVNTKKINTKKSTPQEKKTKEEKTKEKKPKEALTSTPSFYSTQAQSIKGEYQQLVAQTAKDKKNEANAKERNTSVNKKIKRKTAVLARYHQVMPGDTLWKITRKYKGLTIDRLKKMNNLNDRSVLFPGQKLKVSK